MAPLRPSAQGLGDDPGLIGCFYDLAVVKKGCRAPLNAFWVDVRKV